MRLVSRLVLSHALPVGLLAIALTIVLVSLGRVTSSLKDVRDRELGTLHHEEAVHRAAWAIEVAMRHNAEACATGRAPEHAASLLRQRLGELERAQSPAGQSIRESIAVPVEAYRKLASQLVREEQQTCVELQSKATREARERLDEELTNAWISRMYEVHSALLVNEDDAEGAASSAFSGGIVLALTASLLAVVLAQRIGRTVSGPLADLAQSVRRVGQGDFTANVRAEGPREVCDLAEEVEATRKRLERLEALKQSFLASVSHEMRTPLTKIREALSLLSDGAGGELSDRQGRIVKIAQIACEREIRIVTTLLDLSRLRAGVPLKLRNDASVDEVLFAAVKDEEPEAVEAGVQIDLELVGDAAPLSLDVVLVERAIANIIRNAVAVSKKGQRVHLRRSVETSGPSGQRGAFVRIDVHDQGPGIPKEVRNTLFEAFVTSEVSDSPKRVGIGLGLALAREIALAHGGTIDFGEQEEAGTTFRVWLACDRDRASRPSAMPATLSAPRLSDA